MARAASKLSRWKNQNSLIRLLILSLRIQHSAFWKGHSGVSLQGVWRF